MMRARRFASVLAVLLVLAAGCDQERRIAGAEFRRQYELGDMQTMRTAEYLGQREGRAYLRLRTMSTVARDKWREEVVWADVKELAPDFAERLPRKAW